jgi:hypothetical protein
MLGDHRQGLERAPGGRGPERQRRTRAEAMTQRLAHLLGLGEAGAGQRRVEHVALHARRRVEHGLAVTGDQGAHHLRYRTQAIAAASIAVAAPRSL